MYEIMRFEKWVSMVAVAEVVSSASGEENGPSAQGTEPAAKAPDDGFG